MEQSLGSPAREDWSDRYGPDGQMETELAGIALPKAGPDALRRAWSELAPLMQPARSSHGAERAILEAWGRLCAVTINRGDAESTADLRADTVADALADYPADVVVAALRNWPRAHKWRPALSEILADVQWRARYRVKLREAFQREGVA